MNQPTNNRELVAVPDSVASKDGGSARYRLGLRSKGPEAQFTVGESAAGGQNFPWIYLRGTGATYELNLMDGILTVVSRPSGGDDSVQAVRYKIDVEAMTGQAIRADEPMQIVFLYDDVRSADTTTEISEWVATTGPRYIEELRARLGKTDEVVVEMQADIELAQEAGRYGEASRAPRSAQEIASDKDVAAEVTVPEVESAEQLPTEGDLEAEIAGEVDGEEIDGDEPEAVQILDPQTGTIYVGRRWRRRNQSTTLRNLRNASYRVAILTLHNGESATIVLQHPKNLPAIQITTKRGVVKQYLDSPAWDVVITPGEGVRFPVHSPMDGDREIPRGVLGLAPIDELNATGPETTGPVDFEKSNALVRVRERIRDLKSGQSLGRRLPSHSAA